MWFIIRHGQTLHNAMCVRQGRYASLLSLKGIDQIKSIAYRLNNFKDENFDKEYKIISSPMVRTRHSAQIIKEVLGLQEKEVIEEELINEMDYGKEFYNIKKSVLKEKFPEIFNIKKTIDFKYPNGESYSDVYNRCKEFCKKYKNEKNLIIITHGGCVELLRYVLSNIDISNDIFKEITDQNYFFSWDGKNINKL